MTDLAALARANAAAAGSRRPRERIELSAVERHAAWLIRAGLHPPELVDAFKGERVWECRFRRLDKWNLVVDAVIDNNGFQQIAAWYRIAPETVERHVREVLAAWADWREAGIAGAAE